MDFDPYDPHMLRANAFPHYFHLELQYMPADNYFTSNYRIHRQNAIRTILDHYNPEPVNVDSLIPYLAINCFDRFVSRHGLEDPWHFNFLIKFGGNLEQDDSRLHAISCLTIAWRMTDNTFNRAEFLAGRQPARRLLNINAVQLEQVEQHIIFELQQQMLSVMPFCFLPYFVGIIEIFDLRAVKNIIIEAQQDIYYSQYRPSIIAASAILAASASLDPLRFVDYQVHIINTGFVEEVQLLACSARMILMLQPLPPAEPAVVEVLEEVLEGSSSGSSKGSSSGSSKGSRSGSSKESTRAFTDDEDVFNPADGEPPDGVRDPPDTGYDSNDLSEDDA